MIRLLYLFIIFQSVSYFDLLAERYFKDSTFIASQKWEKVKDSNNSNEKVIWKSYRDDESYFNNEDQISDFYELKTNKEKSKLIPRKNNLKYITQLEPFIPLNNFLGPNEFKSVIQWKSSFDGGKAGGTGQQNNSLRLDYGLSENTQLSGYFSEADDDLYNFIDGKRAQYFWQNYAFNIKRRLFGTNKSKYALSISSTLEYWRSSSGSDQTKSIFNEENQSLGKDKFDSIIGSISLPLTNNFYERLTLVLTPGVTFLPERMGVRTNRNNFYGNNFYLGTGMGLNLANDLNILASYTTLLGPGTNYFDSDLNYNKKSIYSFGLAWDVNETISLEGKITNSFGSTPSTGLLTIPSDNLPLYSANFVYRPSEMDTFLKPLDSKDRLTSYGGITVSNALIPERGVSQISFNYDSKNNLFGSYGYSLSNVFQLEILDIGTFKDVESDSNQNINLRNTYLNKNNLNYRFGGKLLLFSPQKDDLFWLTLRTSVGRNNDTNQGYVFSELMNTFRFNDFITINLNPKYLFSGIESLGVVGLSTYVDLSDKMQFISEFNTPLKSDRENTTTFSLRYLYNNSSAIDLYASNAVGIQDLGQILKSNNYKYGIRLNFLY